MALISPTVTRDVVEAKLSGRKSDASGTAFKWTLIACLVFVLGALIALLVSVSNEGLAVLNERAFGVAIIPYTYAHTTFNRMRAGMLVNIEFDVLGKYVERMLAARV